jgi:hypothetical protein
MKPLDICRQRLENQHLIGQRLEKPSEVVALLGAVQAQDYSGAKWAVAQRTLGATDTDVEKEIGEGAILRTHVLRPTWHFVTPADIRWMLALTAPRVKAILSYYDRTLGIDEKELRRSRAVFIKSLRDGKQLTRSELSQALTRARIRTDDGQRLARLVMHAELDGLICSGERRGKQFTYALLDERAPAARVPERDPSLGELATRYFTTHGPATSDDFAWWSGLTKTDAKRGIEIAGSKLEHRSIGGRRYSFPPTTRVVKERSPIARLLPPFDEYFVGLKDRTAMEARLRSANAKAKVGLPSGAPLLIDGQVLGVWKRTLKLKSVAVEVEPLLHLGKREQRAVGHEIEKYGAFVGLPVE